ncbi:tail fiber protein [Vibrio harveyi]|uniref:tail fiber protein n=1 Tax=Vibrio harveyi TaxID=669 RepID=UPI001C717E1F|nr:tail fiber protein [Vibrio harveyi]
MEKLSQRVIVSDEQPLTTDIQYLESFTSSALNRKFSGMVHKGVFRGFECEAMAGKHVLVSSKDITGVALVERDDYVLTVRQNDDVLVDLGDTQDGYLVLEAFYQYGVTTKQVDAKSKIDAALIKFVEVGKQADHHTILCRVTIPPEAADVAAEHISYIERDYGGADIAQHVNTPDPHKQYVLREEKATNQEIDQRSNQLRHALLPQLWRALDNALRSVEIGANSAITSTGNALNGITIGIKTATLKQKGVVQLNGQYSSNSDELAATTAAVQRAVNHVINTCLDKNATAVAAHKLEKAFNLALAGDVTGNVDIDGDNNVSLKVTIKDDSHNHTIGNVDGLRGELDSKSDKTHLHDERYIRSFTLMDEDSQRKSVSQGKFVRFASNPNISLKWAATGNGSESDPYVLQASVPNASVSARGVSQLSNSTTSTDQTKAATSKAVKDAKEQATTAATNNAKNYTDQQIADLTGGNAKHKSVKAVSDAVVSNDQDIAQINQTLPTKANNSTKLKTSGAITGAGQIGDELTIGIKDATTSQKGAVQLDNSVGSTSQTRAATPKAVNDARNKATTDATNNAKNYTNQEIAKLAGDSAAHSTLEEVSDAVVSNDQDIAKINQTLPTKADKSTPLKTSGAVTGAGKIGDGLTIGIKDATTAQKGAVQLSNSVSSTSQTLASTPKATKTAHDRAVAAENAAKAYADQLISQLLGNAPAEHLNTLKELGDALTDNDSDIAAINAELAKKADKAIRIVVSGALTGGGTLGSNVTLGIKDATKTQKGAVQLSSAVNSNSEALAATPKAAKVAYDKGVEALNKANTKLDKNAKAQDSVLLNGRGSSGYIQANKVGSYYGLGANGDFNNWVRTPKNGLIPFNSGSASSLGTSSWKFTNVYGVNGFFDNIKTDRITMKAQASDSASIGCTIVGSATYFDYSLSDDANNDGWRWMFRAWNGDGDYQKLMSLMPTSADAAILDVIGQIKESGQRVFSPRNLNISTSVSENSNTKYAAASAVKKAYDLAASKITQAQGDARYLNINAKSKDTSKLNGAADSQSGTANSIAKRTSSGDLVARLFRSTYANQSTIKGALAFRVNNGSDNYIRFCSSVPAIRAWLDAYSKGEANSRFLSNSAKTTLTENDAYGQASVTFNHKGGTPKQNGSSYRINAAVDDGTATLTIEMQNNAKAGTALTLKQVAVATTSVFDFKVQLKELGQRVFSPNNRNISSSVSSTSTTVYASAKAAKTAYDKGVQALNAANAKWTYKDGNLSQKGAVQLSSAVNSTSEALAATPKAVKIAYDLAASKWKHRAASTTQTGTVQLTNAVNSTSQTLAASAKAVKTAYDKANHSHPYAPTSHRHNFNQIDAGTSSGVFVASDFKGTSDRRLKTDIEPVGDMLGKLLDLKVYEYEKAGNREIGVMAQDLQKLVPTLVGEGEDGYLSVSHFGLNACSIKAIQEQQQIIARQTQIIAEMAQRLSHLEETVNG